ncbi:hypothetical protein [Pendulispora albinea]|uniref:Uncharacterized protein n=1 Tax=Pendulispora albinea TaxID=2741071 RepID=A0ABZ2M6B2_9BACT
MSVCTLQIGDRVVLRAEGGAPEAEHALFVPWEIRDGGYFTTAGDARARLNALGITPQVLEDATLAVRAIAYPFARGDVVRQMLPELGPAELFDGYIHHAGGDEPPGYEGLLLDLRALVECLGLGQGAATTLQAFALAGHLSGVPENTPVHLSGLEDSTAGANRGGDVGRVVDVVKAMRELEAPAKAEPTPRRTEDLLELLIEKGLSQERLSRIQQSLNVSSPPTAGPLSEPEAWDIELGLGNGDLSNAIERIETLEKSRGKRPVTVYLRSRASLLLGSEPPRIIAERVESLCATQAFPELSLLAAQAWLAAGEPDRAVPFARAVLLSTQSSRTTRDRADDILVLNGAPPASARSSHAPHHRERGDSLLSPLDMGWDDAKRSSMKIPQASPSNGTKGEAHVKPSQRNIKVASTDRPSARFALALHRKRHAVPRPSSLSRPPPPPITVPSVCSEPPSHELRSRRTRAWASTGAAGGALNGKPYLETVPMVPVAKVITIEARLSQAPAPPSSKKAGRVLASSQEPGSDKSGPATEKTGPASSGPPTEKMNVAEDTSPTGKPVSSRPPPIPQPPKLDPDRTLKLEPSASTPLALVTQRKLLPASPPAPPVIPSRPTPSGPTGLPSTNPAQAMRGASRPAFQSDPPGLVRIPSTLRLPPLKPVPAELAETLSLPPGLHGQIAPIEDELPRTSLETRILFTHMARRLGREYREKYQTNLRTTVEGIEQMQMVLRDRFPDGVIRTREENRFVRRHGAFLSEILARNLEALWVDIAPTEIGYWAMVVPPKTRVWPFGRVLRFLSQGHRERDLVSYYLEVKNRAHRERTP